MFLANPKHTRAPPNQWFPLVSLQPKEGTPVQRKRGPWGGRLGSFGRVPREPFFRGPALVPGEAGHRRETCLGWLSYALPPPRRFFWGGGSVFFFFFFGGGGEFFLIYFLEGGGFCLGGSFFCLGGGRVVCSLFCWGGGEGAYVFFGALFGRVSL